jgi:glutamyl-tRNA synthetase
VHDRVLGELEHDIAVRPGDFVVRRRDGLYAYQFAVVVDDAAMGITEIVRGFDLFDSTPRQFALFDALAAPRPATWHVPLLTDERGDRFSKRHRSISRSGLEEVGWTPQLLRGVFAWLWGWSPSPVALAAAELVTLWNPATLARESIEVPDAFFEGPTALGLELSRE